jgi:hypothetical protein
MFAGFLERNKTTHRLLVIGGDIHASKITYWNTGDSNEVVAHEVIASGLAQTKFDKRGTIYGEINRPMNVMKHRNTKASPPRK